MHILAIETSCDETGIAIVRCTGNAKNTKIEVVKEVLSSQIKIHAPWGGVVPNLAKREHIKNLPILLKKLLDSRFQILDSIDAIAVTVGPGLEPALWAGIEFAKQLAKQHKKPLFGVNHMEGHLYSVLLSSGERRARAKDSRSQLKARARASLFPAIALIVSGGHTILLRMDSLLKWKMLGETRDDAAGEAFDKVARLLDLPYPGGPEISKIALKGDPLSIPFPQPMRSSPDYDFSFSGLKTAVLYYIKNTQKNADSTQINAEWNPRISASHLRRSAAADIAASFEHAAVSVLAHKTFRAVREYSARSVWLSGGVAANKALRKELAKRAKKAGIAFLVAPKKHNTDNAAMIGAAAYMDTLRKKKRPIRAKGDMAI